MTKQLDAERPGDVGIGQETLRQFQADGGLSDIARGQVKADIKPIEDGTHEFKCHHGFGDTPCPRGCHDAPVHKVSEICGDENWGTICRLSKGHGGNHSEVYSRRDTEPQRPAPDSQPPARVVPTRIFIAPIGLQVRSQATIYTAEQSEPSDIEYAHLEPIRAALEACRPHDEGDGFVAVCKSDWNALVALIKGER